MSLYTAGEGDGRRPAGSTALSGALRGGWSTSLRFRSRRSRGLSVAVLATAALLFGGIVGIIAGQLIKPAGASTGVLHQSVPAQGWRDLGTDPSLVRPKAPEPAELGGTDDHAGAEAQTRALLAQDVEADLAAVRVRDGDADLFALDLTMDAPAAPIVSEGTAASAPVRIALIFDDLGLNGVRTDRALDLPSTLSMAFLPYGELLKPLTRQARDNGHEVMVHLPMEPQGTEDPGPNALVRGLTADEFERRLTWSLGQFGGYRVVNNHMGSLLTEEPEAMAVVMRTLKARGLGFVDSLTSDGSVAYSTARAYGLPAVKRDVFIDHELSDAAIEAALDRLHAAAVRDGRVAVGIAHPHDATLDHVEPWLADLQARGVEFVGVSQALRPAAEPLRLAERR